MQGKGAQFGAFFRGTIGEAETKKRQAWTRRTKSATMSTTMATETKRWNGMIGVFSLAFGRLVLLFP